MTRPLRNTTMRVNIEVNSRDLDEADRRIDSAAQTAERLERNANQSGRAIEQASRRYANAADSVEDNSNALRDNATRARDADRQQDSLSDSARRSGASFNAQSRNVNEASHSLRNFNSAAERLDETLKTLGVAYFASKVWDVGKAAIKTGMEFDKQMSAVKAISGATADEFDAMRKQAIKLGADTTKSASEVASGQLEMAKSGFTVKDTMAAMPGIISASAASGEDMARTTEVMTAALNSFHMEGAKANHVADVLAETANRSKADINDLGYAFKYAAPIANTLGYSLETVAAATGIMTNAGMAGEQAGTSLRMALIRLTDAPEEASKKLEKLGVSITDAKGNMLPFENIVGQLKKSTEGMGNAAKLAAMSTIFGAEAATGMLTVVDAGPEKLKKFSKALENSDGASAKAAKTMQDNFAGAVEELGGTVESIAINVSDVLTPAIKSATNWLSNMGEKFNDLSPTGKKIAVWGSIAVAGVIPVTYVIKKASETVRWLKESLSNMHSPFSRFRREMDSTSASASQMASSLQVANEAAGGTSALSRTERNRSSRRGFFSRFRRGASSAAQTAEAATESLPTRAEYRRASRISRISSIGSKLAKGSGYLSIGLSAIDLLKSTKENIVENLGGMAGSGGGMAIGSLIGSMIAPGIGTAIGGAVGSWAGNFLGDTVGKAIQKSKWFGHAKKSFNDFFKDPLDTSVNFGKTISASTSKAINSYVELASKSKEQLSLLATNGDKYSKSARDAVNKNFSSMADLVEKSFSKTKESTHKNLSVLAKSGMISEKDMKEMETQQAKKQKDKLNAVQETAKKMIQINNKAYKDQQEVTKKAEDKINDIKRKASKEGRILTQTEQEKIKKIELDAANERTRIAQKAQQTISKEEEKQRKNVVASLSKSAKDQKLILGKLKDESGAISAKQAADIVKQSNKARVGAVKEANKKYKDVVSAADQEYYVNGTITKKKHDDIVAKAKSQRNEAVKQAEDMHKNVVEQAKKQAKGHIYQVNWETGESLSKWDQHKVKLADVWNSITGGINKVLKFLHIKEIPPWQPVGSTSTSAKMPTNARGTSFHMGGPSVVGEEGMELAYVPYEGARLVGQNGAEIVDLPRGTRILPHSQTVQMLNGGLQGTMPGYANGTLNAAKEIASAAWDKAKSVGSDIKDVSSTVAEWLAHPVKKAKDLFNKYLPIKGDIGHDAGLGTSIVKYAGSGVQKYLKQQLESFAVPTGGGAANWSNMIIRAAAQMQVALSASELKGIIAQIQRESSGNEKIIQSAAVNDINMRNGNPARGLLQYIPQTFARYSVKGFGDIMNGYHQLLAFFNNSNWRKDLPYGRRGWGPTGARRFAKGGRVNQNRQVLVGEEGPELVDLPFSSQVHNNRKTNELLKQKGNVTIQFAPVINIKIDGSANESNESKIQRAVNASMEKAFKDFKALIDSGWAY